ncbi:MAG: Wzz/FepE/Etk N-terminal domain-containing protein [Patescibacteria group bacterium]
MWHLLLKHYKLIIVWGVVIAVASAGVSFLFPRQYSANSQVLIISKNRTGVDPYTQAKSAETIGTNLVQVLKTTDFYNKVMQYPGISFDKGRWLNLTDRKQRKQWSKDVVATMVYGTGLMNITAYSNSQNDAVNLSSAVTQVMSSEGWQYVGGDVDIKAVSTPLASVLPARPNFILNFVLGFLVGALISSLWVMRYKKHLFGN